MSKKKIRVPEWDKTTPFNEKKLACMEYDVASITAQRPWIDVGLQHLA